MLGFPLHSQPNSVVAIYHIGITGYLSHSVSSFFSLLLFHLIGLLTSNYLGHGNYSDIIFMSVPSARVSYPIFPILDTLSNSPPTFLSSNT